MYEIKVKARLGPETEDDKQVKVLNRVITWKDGVIEYEAGQRHDEINVRGLGFGETRTSVCTLGDKSLVDDEQPLEDADATLCRVLTARAIYLAQDRSDLGYVAKELSRKMSSPTWGDWTN